MSNPFDDDADDSYFSQGRAPTAGRYTSSNKYTTPSEPQEEECNYYEQQIESSMQNTLDSTKRSMRMLEESEHMGVKTAEDLLHQGEQLRTVDKRLDEINSTTVQTQRNLNNIKSVFGGIKNYFSKGQPKSKPLPNSQSASGLDSTVGGMKTGSYESKPSAPPKGKKASWAATTGTSLPADSKNAIAGVERWKVMDDEIDENLGLMSNNLARLRDLGGALGKEIDEQNEILDRVGSKTDKTDTVVRDQDKQMKRILGIKDKKPVVDEKAKSEDAVDGEQTTKSAKRKFW